MWVVRWRQSIWQVIFSWFYKSYFADEKVQCAMNTKTESIAVILFHFTLVSLSGKSSWRTEEASHTTTIREDEMAAFGTNEFGILRNVIYQLL